MGFKRASLLQALLLVCAITVVFLLWSTDDTETTYSEGNMRRTYGYQTFHSSLIRLHLS